MSTERKSVPVSLPSELVERLDALVEDGVLVHAPKHCVTALG